MYTGIRYIILPERFNSTGVSITIQNRLFESAGVSDECLRRRIGDAFENIDSTLEGIVIDSLGLEELEYCVESGLGIRYIQLRQVEYRMSNLRQSTIFLKRYNIGVCREILNFFVT
jgi:hypothetical protein